MHPIKFVATSATKAELGVFFINAQEVHVMHLILHELEDPLLPTPIHCNNLTIVGITNNTVKKNHLPC